MRPVVAHVFGWRYALIVRSIYSDRADSVRSEGTWHNYPDCQLAVTGLSLNTGLNDVRIC